MFKKTGLAAAKYYFADNLTEAYRRRDVHGWNLSHGLYFLADAMEKIEDRLLALEQSLSRSDEARQRQK